MFARAFSFCPRRRESGGGAATFRPPEPGGLAARCGAREDLGFVGAEPERDFLAQAEGLVLGAALATPGGPTALQKWKSGQPGRAELEAKKRAEKAALLASMGMGRAVRV